METIDLSRLSLFAAVAETRNFSRAAERVGLPKSSISRGIAHLEATLGQQLFYRTTRRVTLTTVGTALYQRASPHLTALRQAIGSLPEPHEEPSGVLRLTAPNDLGNSVLAELAARFCARYPTIRLEVELTVRQVDLVAEGFDVALRAAQRLADSSLVVRKVGTIEAQLFAAPAYLARRGTPRTPRDLTAHDLVLFRRFQGPVQLRGRGEPLLPALTARIVADDYSFVREVLRAGGGIGFLPSFLARGDSTSGILERVLPRVSTAHSTLYLVHPAARRVPRKVTAFRDFLLETLASQPIRPRG
jgi:DNA-binding transcriptional LysR family regulator